MEKTVKSLYYNEKCNPIFLKYHLRKSDIKAIYSIIGDVFFHEEFQRRLTDEFPHHGNITVGEHIMEVTVVTYILIKKYNLNVNMEYALLIAMLHDMYTRPWQNTGIKKKSFLHKHGFVHPIPAALNTCKLYEHLFKTPDGKIDIFKSRVILDGIIHHMFILPVASLDDSLENKFEIDNYETIKEINPELLAIIYESCQRCKIDKLEVSLCPSMYPEGNVVSVADKYVSVHQLENLESTIALLGFSNPNVGKKDNDKRQNSLESIKLNFIRRILPYIIKIGEVVKDNQLCLKRGK